MVRGKVYQTHDTRSGRASGHHGRLFRAGALRVAQGERAPYPLAVPPDAPGGEHPVPDPAGAPHRLNHRVETPVLPPEPAEIPCQNRLKSGPPRLRQLAGLRRDQRPGAGRVGGGVVEAPGGEPAGIPIRDRTRGARPGGAGAARSRQRPTERAQGLAALESQRLDRLLNPLGGWDLVPPGG